MIPPANAACGVHLSSFAPYTERPMSGHSKWSTIKRQKGANDAKRGAISKYAVPNRVHFVTAIPKTSVGKLDKKVIRAQLHEEAAATR